MAWYAARSVYLFGSKTDVRNVFEERIVVFEVNSFDEAHLKAENEAKCYASENSFIKHPEQLVYQLDGEKLVSNSEVWSELFEADMDLSEFYHERYTRYVYDSNN